MLYWIFDLDNTLYNVGNQFSYAKLQKDTNLSRKLSLLPEKLILFTNANKNHTYECLKKIGIKDNFNAIIHRDIKPENLVFDNDGYLRLTDFGVAKTVTPENANETSGTPGYMAPEVMCR